VAYRPQQNRWIVLDRLDFTFDNYDKADSRSHERRLVNNLHLNYKPNRKVQLSLYSCLKFAHDTFDDETYSGFTDMLAGETRYNLTSRWDVGVHAGFLHFWNSDSFDYSAGHSIGCSLATNTWVSLG
jgi:hypothetical protein